MSCERFRRVDLAAFRAEPGLPEFEDFARHYPACSDCSREVATWSRLEAALREGGSGSAHPPEERMLAFQSDPRGLETRERIAIERHVAGCLQCRDELAVLRDFDFAVLAAPARVVGPGRRIRAGLTRLGEMLLGVPQPALALAAIVALALPAALLTWRLVQRPGDGAAAQQLARREAPRSGSPSPPPSEVPSGSLARREPEPGSPMRARVPQAAPAMRARVPQAAAEPSEARVAVAEAPETPTRAPTATAAPGRATREAAPHARVMPTVPASSAKPIQIAALLPDELPVYRPDASLVGGSLETIRVTPVVRGAGAHLPRIRVLAPAHMGATREASPTLYWSLDGPSKVPVELTLIAAEGATEPLLELRVESPGAGVHALSLADHGVELSPGTPYLWFAALVPDEARRENDVVSGAGIVRAAPDDAVARELAAAPPARRVHALAAAGYWYDAFATVSTWLEREPDATRLRAYRRALLAQVGLADSER